MNIIIILANIVTIAVVFLIIVYLWLDKKRFRVERQFRAAEELFDEWMELASAVLSDSNAVHEYRSTKNVSRKYRAIGEASQTVWGRETVAMKGVATELEVFLGVYHVLSEDYNRRLNSRFTGKIARVLGFKKFPNIQLETEHVQN